MPEFHNSGPELEPIPRFARMGGVQDRLLAVGKKGADAYRPNKILLVSPSEAKEIAAKREWPGHDIKKVFVGESLFFWTDRDGDFNAHKNEWRDNFLENLDRGNNKQFLEKFMTGETAYHEDEDAVNYLYNTYVYKNGSVVDPQTFIDVIHRRFPDYASRLDEIQWLAQQLYGPEVAGKVVAQQIDSKSRSDEEIVNDFTAGRPNTLTGDEKILLVKFCNYLGIGSEYLTPPSQTPTPTPPPLPPRGRGDQPPSSRPLRVDEPPRVQSPQEVLAQALNTSPDNLTLTPPVQRAIDDLRAAKQTGEPKKIRLTREQLANELGAFQRTEHDRQGFEPVAVKSLVFLVNEQIDKEAEHTPTSGAPQKNKNVRGLLDNLQIRISARRAKQPGLAKQKLQEPQREAVRSFEGNPAERADEIILERIRGKKLPRGVTPAQALYEQYNPTKGNATAVNRDFNVDSALLLAQNNRVAFQDKYLGETRIPDQYYSVPSDKKEDYVRNMLAQSLAEYLMIGAMNPVIRPLAIEEAKPRAIQMTKEDLHFKDHQNIVEKVLGMAEEEKTWIEDIEWQIDQAYKRNLKQEMDLLFFFNQEVAREPYHKVYETLIDKLSEAYRKKQPTKTVSSTKPPGRPPAPKPSSRLSQTLSSVKAGAGGHLDSAANNLRRLLDQMGAQAQETVDKSAPSITAAAQRVGGRLNQMGTSIATRIPHPTLSFPKRMAAQKVQPAAAAVPPESPGEITEKMLSASLNEEEIHAFFETDFPDLIHFIKNKINALEITHIFDAMIHFMQTSPPFQKDVFVKALNTYFSFRVRDLRSSLEKMVNIHKFDRALAQSELLNELAKYANEYDREKGEGEFVEKFPEVYNLIKEAQEQRKKMRNAAAQSKPATGTRSSSSSDRNQALEI